MCGFSKRRGLQSGFWSLAINRSARLVVEEIRRHCWECGILRVITRMPAHGDTTRASARLGMGENVGSLLRLSSDNEISCRRSPGGQRRANNVALLSTTNRLRSSPMTGGNAKRASISCQRPPPGTKPENRSCPVAGSSACRRGSGAGELKGQEDVPAKT